MPRLTDEERLERARISKERAEAEMRALTARLRSASRKADRKADTRRKIIIGAMFIEEAKKREDVSKWITTRIGKLSDRDKAAFAGWSVPMPSSSAKEAGE